MKAEIIEDLKARWDRLLAGGAKLRIRDAAKELGVSEAELLATGCGKNVRRLQGPWDALIREFPRLGHVMCLTRNEAAVHERHGEFRQIDFFHGMGQIVGHDIDLRLFMSHWQIGFAVEDATPEGVRRSFQFFDQDGTAIHKVYLQASSDHTLFEELTVRHLNPDQGSTQLVLPLPPAQPEKPDSEIDGAGLAAAWRGMQDTHEFFSLLKKFSASRLQAFRLAGPEFAVPVSDDATRRVLEQAAAQDVAVMIFVGSPGVIQIHTGPVENVKTFGNWVNILDNEFNLHLREDLISQTWLVRKPTRDGVVTSLELYDDKGENIALIFGKRKPGEKEDVRWREIVAALSEGER